MISQSHTWAFRGTFAHHDGCRPFSPPFRDGRRMLHLPERSVNVLFCGGTPFSAMVPGQVLSPGDACRLALLDHLLAVGIERVVDDPFGGVEGMIILEAETAKA